MSHDPSVKAAVIAALMTGQGVSEVAREYNLDKSVVSRWKSQLSVPDLQQIATKKERDFGEMLGDYLEELITTAKAQQIFFRDRAWMEQQPADQLAVLHGVSLDKGIRLFEAAARVNGQSGTAALEEPSPRGTT